MLHPWRKTHRFRAVGLFSVYTDQGNPRKCPRCTEKILMPWAPFSAEAESVKPKCNHRLTSAHPTFFHELSTAAFLSYNPTAHLPVEPTLESNGIDYPGRGRRLELSRHGRQWGETQCPTAVMHDQCDPATCDKAPAFTGGHNDGRFLYTDLKKLKLCAVQGCDTCATLYAGVRGVRWDPSQGSLHSNDSLVLVHAVVSVSEPAFLVYSGVSRRLQFCVSQMSSELLAGRLSQRFTNSNADNLRPCRAFKREPAPTPSRSTFSDTAFQTIAKWLHECRNSHKTCGDYDNLPCLPTRVLDLGPNATTGVSVRLYLSTLNSDTIGISTFASLRDRWTARKLCNSKSLLGQ
jgi:hypothetical protein